MSILAWINNKTFDNNFNSPHIKEGSYQIDSNDLTNQPLWTRCDFCGVILYLKHLSKKHFVCVECGLNLSMTSTERINNLIDFNTWIALDELMSPCNPLLFNDKKTYFERLDEAQKRTNSQDAIETGVGLINKIPVGLGVMNFDFMGGSMGSVVGEKITRLIEYCTSKGLPLILICASGGARMQEGILSLMQMGKISAALKKHQLDANLFYISILTSPTTGGVTASFAMLGDIIIAEPHAVIGFAGRRVIEQTLKEKLPENFQTAEYLLNHGLVDLIIDRKFLKSCLSEVILFNKVANYKKTGSKYLCLISNNA